MSKVYKRIFDSSCDGIILIDKKGIIIQINKSCCRIFGYQESELVGQKVNMLMPSPHKEAHDRYLRQYREEKTKMPIKPRKVKALNKSGESIFVELSIFEIDDERCAGIIRDLQYVDDQEKEHLQDLEDRNMFAANISHELRTPLNSIINMTVLLKDAFSEIRNLIPNDKYDLMDDQISTISRSGTILLTQINDLLDYAKLSAHKLTLKHESFSLRKCVEECQQIHAPIARIKEIEILTCIEPDVPNGIIGDEDRLTQVLVNLIGNAVKFTEKGKITITVSMPEEVEEEETRTIKFSITDTGIGIDDADRKKLFQAFVQIDGSHVRKYEGTGLGLVISKKICQLMNGDIWLEKSALGLGSTFSFTIKCKINSTVRHVIAHDDIKYLKGKHVLLVDDQQSNLDLFITYLLEWEMIPIATTNPNTALLYVKRSQPFDIILLDIKMPQINGLQLAQKIMDHREYCKKQGMVIKECPLLALSSAGPDISSKHFDSILQKPITKDMLLRKMLQLVLGIHENNKVSKRSNENKIPILVAEDNVDNQKVIRGLLKKNGFTNVMVVENGRLAIDELERNHYSIVLLDIKMPVMSGLEAATYINSHYSGLNKPKLIALTAVATYGERDFYIKEGGMDDYISKPINEKDLVNTLGKYLGSV